MTAAHDSDLPVPVQQTAIVEPGDTLIIRFDPNVPRAEGQRVLEGIREHIPEDITIVAVCAAELAVVKQGLTSVSLQEPPEDVTEYAPASYPTNRVTPLREVLEEAVRKEEARRRPS